MKRLAITIDPLRQSWNDIEKLMVLAKSYGYSEVYFSLTVEDSFDGTKMKEPYLKFLDYSNNNDWRIHANVSYDVLQLAKVVKNDLTYFKDHHIDCLKLEFGFENNDLVSSLTHNLQGIIIEDNASLQDDLIARLKNLQTKGNLKQYAATHNYYVRPDTGLSFDHCMMKTRLFKSVGVEVGIYVNSLASVPFLFPLGNGCCTMESHRYTSALLSVSEVVATGVYDTIGFGPLIPSDTELQDVSRITLCQTVEIPVYFVPGIDQDLKNNLLATVFQSRSDQAAYLVRATQFRHHMHIEPFNCVNRERLSLTLDNTLSGKYEGEVQIALKYLPSQTYVNVIAQVELSATKIVELIHGGKTQFILKEFSEGGSL